MRKLICWSCGKEHDSKDIPYNINAKDKSYKCECGGYVVSPSGKVKMKASKAFEGQEFE